MSALVLNSPTKNNMRIFENGNELNPNTDSKKYNFAEDRKLVLYFTFIIY